MYFVWEETFAFHSSRIGGGFWVSHLSFLAFTFSERWVNWEFEEWFFWLILKLVSSIICLEVLGWWYGDAWAQADSCVWALLIVLDVSYNKFTLLTIFCSWNLSYLKHPKTFSNVGHRWPPSQSARYLNSSLYFIRSNVDFRPTVNYL